MAITSLDMNPKFSASNPSMNKRWPPLADKTSLPYKLTSLSRQKLAREATAPNPDIRRCLGHFRLHCSSMEWAQKDMTTRINSFEMEDDDEDEEEEVQQQQEEKEIKELPLLGADHEDKNKVKGRKDDEDEEDSDRKPLHVRFQISVKPSTTTTTTTTTTATPSQSSSPSQSSTSSSPSSPSEAENAKDGLLEKGISCIQKTRQHFWSNPGQCIPIRIAN